MNTTTYTLDVAAGLTQVLSDGTSTYLYGKGRIGEEQPSGWQYPLGDALGSMRQLTDPAGEFILAKTFEPFGSALMSIGDESTNYPAENVRGERRLHRRVDGRHRAGLPAGAVLRALAGINPSLPILSLPPSFNRSTDH